MRKKSTFEKITDVMIVGGVVTMAFCFGMKVTIKKEVLANG